MSPLPKSVKRPVETSNRSKVAQEEASIEAKIVELITEGNWNSLEPNTGKSVEVQGSHVCVDYREEVGSAYRTWEWHGHCMLYVEGQGYVPEYIYGNYFEPLFGEMNASGGFVGGRTVGRTGGLISRMSAPLGLGEIMNGGLGLRKKDVERR